MTVLFVIGTILFFLTLDFVVRKVKGEATVPALERAQRAGYPIRVPEGIFFAKSHTWVNLFASGKVRLGVDDFVGRLLGNPQVTFLRKAGENVKKGDPLMVLRSEKHSLTIRSPLDGDITGVNEELAANPDRLRVNLFSSGWGYEIKPARLSEIKNFLLGTEARAWVRSEFSRLREFFAGIGQEGVAAPAYLQDGGLPFPGVLNPMDDAVWNSFEREFLNVE